MNGRDVRLFDRFARFYELFMFPANVEVLTTGLGQLDGTLDRVLDIGGGTGRAIRTIDAPERVVIDPALGMLRQVPPPIERVRATATSLPVSDEAVDAVLIVDALHHMPDIDAVLVEASRVLRSGGVLVVRDFDRATLRGRLLVATEHLVGFESTFLTVAELYDRVASVGLEATVTDTGFACTVVGRKPGLP